MLPIVSSGTGGCGNTKTSRDHPNHCIIKIGQNTEKSAGDEETFYQSNFSGKQSVKTGVKNSQINKMMMKKQKESEKRDK